MASGEPARRAGALAAAAIAVTLAATPARADAGPDAGPPAVAASPRDRARALYDAAERAFAERRHADAVAAYDRALAEDPSAPFATVARAKLADLRAHAEGGFAPLARLDEVRRDPAKARERAAIEALARDLEAFPPGPVRSEARLVVAEAFWHALGEPRRAAAQLAAILDDPAADRLVRALALTELVAIDKELGDLEAALEATRRHPDLTPSLGAELERLARRARVRVGAAALVGLLSLLGAASFARAVVRARDPRPVVSAVVRPLAVAFALWLGGGAAVLVHLRGGEDPRPFLLLGVGVLALDVVARAWRLASRDERLRARALRAASCAAGVVAVAFLVLDRTAAGVLEALGL